MEFRSQLTILILSFSFTCFGQSKDSLPKAFHLSGTALVTNNGISFIPTFSLGKPATIVTLSMGTKRLSFEPEFRFSLEGKPWAILLWGRYKLSDQKDFKLIAGTHLGLSYSTPTILLNGINTDIIQVKRYWANELVPNYQLSKKISVGMYYLYSHGLDAGATKNTHFITLNTNITHIPITNKIYANFKPQLYYLQLDAQDGYFTSAAISLQKQDCPFSIASIMSEKINSNIVTNDFVWNISLNYSFNHTYLRK